MPDALAWTAEQVFRTADLPNREVKAVAPRASGLAVKAAVDKTWRCRAEIARIAGVDQSTAGRMLALMLSTGEAEYMPRRRMRPAQYRRVSGGPTQK